MRLAWAAVAALVVVASVAAAWWWAPGRKVAESVVPPLTPAEPRPPGILPSAKWLPESPRYQQARRAAHREIQAVRDRLDLSTSRRSRKDRFRVDILERPEPVPLGAFQDWEIRITDADGNPVVAETVNVGGGMPQHGHGLPTRPVAVALEAAGHYRVEGLQFGMPGWWEVHLFISHRRRDDVVTFNLLLE